MEDSPCPIFDGVQVRDIHIRFDTAVDCNNHVMSQPGSNQSFTIQVYADPDSCNRFYKCENGTMSLETCENGLLFDQEMALTDGIHNYCVYNWRVECGDRLADNTPESSPGS